MGGSVENSDRKDPDSPGARAPVPDSTRRPVALQAAFILLVAATLLGGWLLFSPDPAARALGSAIDGPVNAWLGPGGSLAHRKAAGRVGAGERWAMRLLYGSMIVVGRVPLPEAADNLSHLFVAKGGGDYLIWPSYLVASPSVRRCIAGRPKGSAATNCSIPRNQIEDDPRTAYLYNPWQTRVEERGWTRRVTIFQWMEFAGASTPFPPWTRREQGGPWTGGWVNLRITPADNHIHVAWEDEPYTAYASWVEPAIPLGMAAGASRVLHLLGRIAAGLLLAGGLMVLPVALMESRRTDPLARVRLASRGLALLGRVGVGVCIFFASWDLLVLLGQALALAGTDSGTLIEPYAERPGASESDGLLTLLGWGLWRLAQAGASVWLCLRIVASGRCLATLVRRPVVRLGAALSLVPWLGLGFPLCLVGVPWGLWVLWITTDPRLVSEWRDGPRVAQ